MSNVAAFPAHRFDYDALPSPQSDELRNQAARIRERLKNTTASIIEIGRDLLAVKQNIDHGRFVTWVQIECGFSIRSAENYIKAAKFSEGKNATVALLAPATLYRLAAKNTPPEIVNAVIDRIQAGDVVLDREVVAALQDVGRKRKAERRAASSKLSRDALARKEKKHREWATAEQKRHTAAKSSALFLIDTIGEENARLLLNATHEKDHGWLVLGEMEALLRDSFVSSGPVSAGHPVSDSSFKNCLNADNGAVH